MRRSKSGGLPFTSSGKVSLKEVEKFVARLEIEPSGNLDVCSSEAVGVAALQIQVRLYDDLSEYIADMNSYIAEAVNYRAQIVVLPAFAGLLPISSAPQFRAHLQKLFPPEGEDSEQDLSVGDAYIDPQALNDALAHLSDYTFDAYFYTMAALAARHRVYIMAGSTLYFEEDELCHRAFLFNDEGALAGYQDKISEGALEVALQIPPESEVKVFDTPMGNVSILIGSDASHFEIARVAARQGAKILLCPCAFADVYDPVDSTLGPNMRAQENRVYAAMSSLVGETGLGFSLEGGGRIFAPNELLRSKNGVAAKTLGRHQPETAFLFLNLDKLDGIRNPYTQDTNKEFMNKNVDKLY